MRDRIRTPLEKFSLLDARPDDKIAVNFTLAELVKSDIAARQRIDNWFRTDNQLRWAVRVCRELLQPLRAKFGPFSPNSVFRSQTLERALKGQPADWKSRSQHTLGQAADIEIPVISNKQLAEYIKGNLPFDQLILECYTPGQPTSGWVHVSLSDTPRGEVLSYIKGRKGWEYKPGLL